MLAFPRRARRRFVLAALPLALASGAVAGLPGPGGTFTQTFEDPFATSAWTFPGGFPMIVDTGGNPSPYLAVNQYQTDLPALVSLGAANPAFLGSYRTRNVQSLSVDLIVTNPQNPQTPARNIALRLVSDNGTTSTNDDWAATTVSSQTLDGFGSGWQTFQFQIPSLDEGLPNGWFLESLGSNPPDDPDWLTLMGDVAQVQFFVGDPRSGLPVQTFWLGADNVTVQLGATPGDCEGDVNGDLLVNFDDLNELLNDFGFQGVSNADLNGDGVVNFPDLNLLLNAFGQPCGV